MARTGGAVRPQTLRQVASEVTQSVLEAGPTRDELARALE